MSGRKVSRKQKKVAVQDARRISKDSGLIRKDIKQDRYLAVRANSRDIDKSLQSLDRQMETLDRAKDQVKNNREAYGAINSQKGILKQQRKQLSLLKKNRKMEKKSGKIQRKAQKQTSGDPKVKLSIGSLLGLQRRGK